MRRFDPGSVWPTVLLLAWGWLAVSQVSAAGPTQGEDGVAEFIRTHPNYRGYVAPHPPYPLVARAKHEQGTVVVRITFAREGQVSAVKLVKSSGYWALDSSTINYIKACWRSTLGKEKTVTKALEYGLQ